MPSEKEVDIFAPQEALTKADYLFSGKHSMRPSIFRGFFKSVLSFSFMLGSNLSISNQERHRQ